MYLRIAGATESGRSTVAYYALAESVWNTDAKRPEARVVTISVAPIRSSTPHCSA